MAKYISTKSMSYTKLRKHEKNKYHKSRKSEASLHSAPNEGTKTPPLPVGNTMEDLLKKRDSLKEELRKMKYLNNSHHSKARNTVSKTTNETPRKRSKVSDVERKQKELSPEITEPQDSEDEENIIEQRRKQRKLLLEKLTNKVSSNITNIEMSSDHTADSTENEFEEKNPAETISADKKSKEIKDMFSESNEFDVPNSAPDEVKQESNSNIRLNDNWDDPEGYYNIIIGDNLDHNRYTIKSTLGQGIFASVIRALDKKNGNSEVAIKIARNNDLMYKNALKEITTLKEVNDADPESRFHCVKYLRYFIHKEHLCIVLEPLSMDLRSVIKKYGKHHGLNIKALASYSRQLLLALRHLKKVGIVHADIKPDNILVNEKKNVLKLCDFGSAEKLHENDPKPYLVSRFYRAPEVILGINYGHPIDTWATGCTIYELATGKILFTGSSNNKMLKCFMDVKGKIPNRLIKKGKFKDQHFNYNYNYLMHVKDKVTGREKVIEVSSINATRNVLDELKRCSETLTPYEEKKIGQLKDLIDKMITLDPQQRPSPSECLHHPFIKDNTEN